MHLYAELSIEDRPWVAWSHQVAGFTQPRPTFFAHHWSQCSFLSIHFFLLNHHFPPPHSSVWIQVHFGYSSSARLSWGVFFSLFTCYVFPRQYTDRQTRETRFQRRSLNTSVLAQPPFRSSNLESEEAQSDLVGPTEVRRVVPPPPPPPDDWMSSVAFGGCGFGCGFGRGSSLRAGGTRRFLLGYSPPGKVGTRKMSSLRIWV